MNKEEFLTSLRKKLSILEEGEIEDILNEYEGYIEEKIVGGSTEKEAVSSMGNIDELAKDLLSAYKIREPQEKNKDAFNRFTDNCINVFERIVDMFANKSLQEILRFVIEIVVIFLIIGICKIPFEIIESFGRNALYALGNGPFRVLSNIWSCILEFVYLIFAVLFFVKIFQSRYLDNAENTKSFSFKESKKQEVFEEKESKKTKEEPRFQEENRRKEKKERTREHLSIIDVLVDICMLFVKMIAFFILIGVIFYVVGMSITVGFSIYLLFKGVFYFGVYLILFALAALGIVAFIYLYNFIFNHKNKVGVLLIISLVCFVLLGLGVGISAIEFASTTIVYNDVTNKEVKNSFTFDFREDLLLDFPIENENRVTFDESLKNQIKVEYAYNDTYFKIKAEPYVSKRNGYHFLYPWYRLDTIKYSKDHLDVFIENLKHKKVHIYNELGVDIRISMSRKTYDALLANKEKYDSEIDKVESVDDICAYLEEQGYDLPHYCIYNHRGYGMHHYGM